MMINMTSPEFRVTTIPAISDEERNRIRGKVGLKSFVGEKPFTEVHTRPNYAHTTDNCITEFSLFLEGVEADLPNSDDPTAGTAKRRAGAIGNIQSFDAPSVVSSVIS